MSFFIILSSCTMLFSPRLRGFGFITSNGYATARKAWNRDAKAPGALPFQWKETIRAPVWRTCAKLASLSTHTGQVWLCSVRRRRALIRLLGVRLLVVCAARRDPEFVHLIPEHPSRDMERARRFRDHAARAPQPLLNRAAFKVFRDLRQIKPAGFKFQFFTEADIR